MEGKDVGSWDLPDVKDTGSSDAAVSTTATTAEARAHKPRGFAAMNPERQREIASKGGRTSHARGTGHEWNSDAAREAGRKGGLAGKGKVRRRRAKPTEAPAVATAPSTSNPAEPAADVRRTREHAA